MGDVADVEGVGPVGGRRLVHPVAVVGGALSQQLAVYRLFTNIKLEKSWHCGRVKRSVLESQ